MEMQLLRELVKRRIADVAAAVAVKARPKLLEATAQEQQLEATQATS
jgi:BMFP domain-containing protein YqiC